jgi:hypothetical protein
MRTKQPTPSRVLAPLRKVAEPLAIMSRSAKRFTYYKCDGFEVWGQEYQDLAGTVTWRLRVFSDHDRKIATYEDVTVGSAEGTRTGESQAMRDAIAAWLEPSGDQDDLNLGQPSPRVERFHNVPQILKTMTVLKAALLWDDPRAVHLRRWGETFEITLEEFHISHFLTYEKDRRTEVNYAVMWSEVIALRALLKYVGLGEEIESHYMTPLDRVKLTTEEINTLSPRARAYIAYLEQAISSLNAESEKTKSALRKINRGRKR